MKLQNLVKLFLVLALTCVVGKSFGADINRFNSLVAGSYESQSGCGVHVYSDSSTYTIYLSYVSGCSVGTTLTLKCAGPDAQGCKLDGAQLDTASVLPDGTIILIHPKDPNTAGSSASTSVFTPKAVASRGESAQTTPSYRSIHINYRGCYDGYIQRVNLLNASKNYGCASRSVTFQHGKYYHDYLAHCYNGLWLTATVTFNEKDPSCSAMASMFR